MATIKIETEIFNNLSDNDAGILIKQLINNEKKVLTLKIAKRKEAFAETLKPFIDTYGKDMLNDFYKYWTELNKSGTKFRQELEKTWSLDRRLEMWNRNSKNSFKNNSNPNIITLALESHNKGINLIEQKYGNKSDGIGSIGN